MIRIKLYGKPIGQQINTNLRGQRDRMADAARAAINEAGNRIVVAGKADMLKGGNFGSSRWQNSLHANVAPPATHTTNLILSILHRVPFARIFEYGGTIVGRPLLWIPLPWNPSKVRARDFPGQLFRVDRAGKNPLLMTKTGDQQASAMYVGVKSVKQRRRFHLRPIIRRVAKQMPFLYKRAMRLARRR